jgi:integration host factor subunit beta
MTKSELINLLAERQQDLVLRNIESGVKGLLDQMVQALAEGRRIEIRGFGSFSLHYREARMGRNPRTGESVALPSKQVPHFKAGKALRERANYKKPPKVVKRAKRAPRKVAARAS